MAKETISISFGKPQTVDIEIKKNIQNVSFQKSDKVAMSILKIPKNHSDLKGLDYESSGHTGFASSKQLEEHKTEIRTIQFEFEQKVNNELNQTLSILNTKVPKRLNDISPLQTKDSANQYVYVDDDGKDGKISIKEMNSRLLRTVNDVPNDMELNTYIFLNLNKGDE